MRYNARVQFQLKAEPNDAAADLALVTPTWIIEDSANANPNLDPTWLEVRVKRRQNNNWVTGFARKAWLEPAALPPPEVDLPRFGRSCLDAARAFGSNAFYLIALAEIESGIRNIPTAGGASSAFGPFQILRDTWDEQIAADPAFAGFSSHSRYDPYKQAGVAARLAALATVGIVQALGRIPIYSELYLCHLFGQRGGTTVLGQPLVTPIDQALLPAYQGAADPAASVAAVMNGNAGLLSNGGVPRTVQQVLDEVVTRMQPGFDKATQIIAMVEPNLAAGQGNGNGVDPASVPWMTQARNQIGVTEVAGPGSNPQIEAYLNVTNAAGSEDDTPWCAAFVSWCLKNCGDPAIANGALGSAWAADWLAYGEKSDTPAYGHVCVLSPLADGTSGHVGFITQWNTAQVELLAGNQANPDRVVAVWFSRSLVSGFRRPVARP